MGSFPPVEERPAWYELSTHHAFMFVCSDAFFRSAAALTQVGYAVMVVTDTEMDWTFYESGTDIVLDHVLLVK